ncbi:hypothetical protein [Granulicella arctica]|uniref:Uncharacterized protein with HEPN domain n=1 Tax=Granulicella arctica TaxID=940613 RepID=A0A7Y9PH12_9BACT|nr:hypothetical protein [Granulicella arctica]NYF79745.1 uncharacterized protein with HEPN domain [Granulicella arctica]
MTDTNDSEFPDFDTMTPADFERYLPDFFAASSNGRVSSDPKLQQFLADNPDCAALVRDLEAIAEAARAILEPVEEPSDLIWDNLQKKLQAEAVAMKPDHKN